MSKKVTGLSLTVEEGRKLPTTFGGPVQFEEIPASCFLPHEEQPEAFAARALTFLDSHASEPRA